jgi:hypothetical protein
MVILRAVCKVTSEKDMALSCMVALLGYRGGRTCLAGSGAEILSALDNSDKGGVWPETVCPLMTQSEGANGLLSLAKSISAGYWEG